MTNIESPNATLHKSAVHTMMDARLELCNKKEYVDILNNHMQEHFKNCSISFNSTEYIIKTDRVISNAEAECMMWASIVGCLKEMAHDNIIDMNLYNKCLMSPSLLYFIIMNSSNTIKIEII